MTPELVAIIVKGFFGAIFFGLIGWVGVQIKRLVDQKRDNAVEAIKLEGGRIALQNDTMDLDALVAKSNSEHGLSPGSGSGVEPSTVGDTTQKK